MNNSEFKKLIDKYLNETATQNEKDRLFAYYERFQANQDWQEEVMGNKEEARERLFNKISHEIDVKESRSSFSIWKIAITIILIMSVGFFGLHYFKGGLGAGEETQYKTLSATNHVMEIRLEDGTKVWLNNGSKLSYPVKFGDKRVVTLEGEAYFNVAHQRKPFIIHSGKMTTQVFGTTFNVQAYPANNINKVSVVSGKVGVTVAGKQQKKVFLLTRNQEIAFNKKSKIISKVVLTDASTAISWIDNKIKFRNTPLPEAMQELERIYNIDITHTDGLKTCLVFADFSRKDAASKVLSMLAKSLSGKVIQKDSNTFYITGRPCK